MKLHSRLMFQFDGHGEVLGNLLILGPSSDATHHEIILVSVDGCIPQIGFGRGLKRVPVAPGWLGFKIALEAVRDIRGIIFFRASCSKMFEYIFNFAAAQQTEVHLRADVFGPESGEQEGRKRERPVSCADHFLGTPAVSAPGKRRTD